MTGTSPKVEELRARRALLGNELGAIEKWERRKAAVPAELATISAAMEYIKGPEILEKLQEETRKILGVDFDKWRLKKWLLLSRPKPRLTIASNDPNEKVGKPSRRKKGGVNDRDR